MKMVPRLAEPNPCRVEIVEASPTSVYGWHRAEWGRAGPEKIADDSGAPKVAES